MADPAAGPAPDEQVTFLVKMKPLLAARGFVASNKFALLVALTERSVALVTTPPRALDPAR